MAKKQYYIPTVEVIAVNTQLMQDFGLGGSGSHAQSAPAVHRAKVF